MIELNCIISLNTAHKLSVFFETEKGILEGNLVERMNQEKVALGDCTKLGLYAVCLQFSLCLLII